MPNVSLYNQDGKSVGEISLSEAMFAVKANPAFVHEIVLALQANKRKAIANTKTKGEVRGGGKKPWKQKGTGRARQGSIRSPNWVGGGIAFGPSSERNFHVKINKKAKRQALFMALSDKLNEKKLVVVDAINAETPKTKVVATLMQKLPVEKTVLLVTPASQPNLMRMVRNLPNVKAVGAGSVGLLDVLAYRSVVFMKDAIPAFEKLFAS
jgi:large subunit ribosomal protein L4